VIEWHDEGIVLSARRHGEADAVVTALTFEHGRHAGLVKGGASRRQRPILEPGNRLALTWRARLADHLGSLAVDPIDLFASRLLDRPLSLAALGSAMALVEAGLAEREPHGQLYAALLRLVRHLERDEEEGDGPVWLETYVRFELLLLQALGFGLDLERCAVTGRSDDLVYVSPRTGRAVSREGAGAYAPRLLPLPPFLKGEGSADADQIAAALRLAGHFLDRHLLAPQERTLPPARDRLLQLCRDRWPKEEG